MPVFYGEINGRFVKYRERMASRVHQLALSIRKQTALVSQVSRDITTGEGIRIRPILFNNYLHLSYSWLTSIFCITKLSFQRLATNLYHEISLYKKEKALCSAGDNNPNARRMLFSQRRKAPKECLQYSRRVGTIGLDFSASLSMTQATIWFLFISSLLWRLDINGNPCVQQLSGLSALRANVIFFRQSFEHSIWGPLGFSFMVDEERWD